MGKNRDIAVRRQGVEVAMDNSHCFNIYMNRLSACLTQIIPLIARTGTRHLCVEVQWHEIWAQMYHFCLLKRDLVITVNAFRTEWKC